MAVRAHHITLIHLRDQFIKRSTLHHSGDHTHLVSSNVIEVHDISPIVSSAVGTWLRLFSISYHFPTAANSDLRLCRNLIFFFCSSLCTEKEMLRVMPIIRFTDPPPSSFYIRKTVGAMVFAPFHISRLKLFRSQPSVARPPRLIRCVCHQLTPATVENLDWTY